MIRRLFALALVLAPVGLVLDRWLAGRRGATPPKPMRMLVVVDAPINETWSVLADIPLQVEWMREMKRVELTTPGPTGVGTRGTALVRVFGIPVADPVEVVAFEPPTRFAIRHEGLFTGGGLITLESGADGRTTIVRWDETLRPPLLPDLGGLIIAPILRPIFQADLHRFRRLVETGSADD
jgi:Polyketide cyclase / dehydrase and lipid transport